MALLHVGSVMRTVHRDSARLLGAIQALGKMACALSMVHRDSARLLGAIQALSKMACALSTVPTASARLTIARLLLYQEDCVADMAALARSLPRPLPLPPQPCLDLQNPKPSSSRQTRPALQFYHRRLHPPSTSVQSQGCHSDKKTRANASRVLPVARHTPILPLSNGVGAMQRSTELAKSELGRQHSRQKVVAGKQHRNALDGELLTHENGPALLRLRHYGDEPAAPEQCGRCGEHTPPNGWMLVQVFNEQTLAACKRKPLVALQTLQP